MKFKIRLLIGLALLLASVIPLKAQYGQGWSQFANAGTAVNGGTNWLVIPGELGGQIQNSEGTPVSPIPVITFLSVRAFDNTVYGATLQSYYSTNSAVITGPGYPGALVTNMVQWPNGTNGLTCPTWAVLKHNPQTNTVAVTTVIYGQTNTTYAKQVVKLPDQIADEAVYITSTPPGIYTVTNTYNNWPVYGQTNSVVTTNVFVVFQNNPLQTVNPNDELYYETPGALISVASQGTVTPTTFNSNAGILSGERRKPFLLTLSTVSGVGTNTIDAVNANLVP